MSDRSTRIIDYPTCGDWSCDDDYDWEAVGPEDSQYRWVKREEQIVRYHQPQTQWRKRLQEERDRVNGGDPLWHRK